jgi:DNA-binding CsgD family transcriptional regulator
MEALVIKEGQRVITQRELDVVEAISLGKRPMDIGVSLDISGRTVESILSRLMKDFECRSSTHLVATFLRKKIIK